VDLAPAIGLLISLLNGIAVIWLSKTNTGKQDRKELHDKIAALHDKYEDRMRSLERELATVDQRIMVATHNRVKRMPEFGDFKGKVEDFMDEVRQTGLLK